MLTLIKRLWDVLGDGEVLPIAEYAAKHFETYKRPLRIAIDEAGWRFNNLTDFQVAKIREKEPAANPIEKTILWRILHYAKLNVQLLFVFDGPRRPWKRGRRGGGGKPGEYYDRLKLLVQLLDHVKVPHHRAPAEAEAKCARLQQLGIVDAVLSDDGDTLMFGCTTLIREHKVKQDRVEGCIRVYTADRILRDHGIDRYGWVLFVMLCGGDYCEQGLPGCGPEKARLVSRSEHGLGKQLVEASQLELRTWRAALQEKLRAYGKSVYITGDFPDWKALGHYRNPKVSSDDQLTDLRALRRGWEIPIEQEKLREFLRDRFNFWTRGFLKHLAPIFLVRALARKDCQNDNTSFDVKIKKTKAKKGADGEESARAETKITFLPLKALSIAVSQQPMEEDWFSKGFVGKDGEPYDPKQRIECEVLDCILRNGLPSEVLNAPLEAPVRKKRAPKTSTGAEEDIASSVRPTKKRKRRMDSMDDEAGLAEVFAGIAPADVPAVTANQEAAANLALAQAIAQINKKPKTGMTVRRQPLESGPRKAAVDKPAKAKSAEENPGKEKPPKEKAAKRRSNDMDSHMPGMKQSAISKAVKIASSTVIDIGSETDGEANLLNDLPEDRFKLPSQSKAAKQKQLIADLQRQERERRMAKAAPPASPPPPRVGSTEARTQKLPILAGGIDAQQNVPQGHTIKRAGPFLQDSDGDDLPPEPIKRIASSAQPPSVNTDKLLARVASPKRKETPMVEARRIRQLNLQTRVPLVTTKAKPDVIDLT